MERNFRPIVPLIALIYLLVILALITGYLLVESALDRKYQANLVSRLQDNMIATEAAVNQWADRRKREAIAASTLDIVRDAANSLMDVSDDREALLDHPDQQRLRDHFGPYLASGHIEGYFIIAPNGISLASSRIANTGTPNLLLDQSDQFLEAFAGATLITRLQPSDVPLNDDTSPRGTATQFVIAPIWNKDGVVSALIALRLSPRDDLLPLIESASLQMRLNAYAFDSDGNLLSKAAAKSRTPLLRTLPVRQALQGNNDISTDGYLNHAGEDVVGAWLYNADLGLGFVTEIDRETAYGLRDFFKTLDIVSLFAAIVVSTLAALAALRVTRLAEHKKRFVMSLMAANKDVNFIVNARGTITNVNPAFRSVFGLDPQFALGSEIGEFARVEDETKGDLTEKGLKALAAYPSDTMIRGQGIGKGKAGIPIGLRVDPIDSDSSDENYLVVVHDYRDIERREATLRDAYEKAEEGNRTKSSFLSTISHELRSPLISVISALDLIGDRLGRDEDASLISSSRRSAKLLLSMIDDVLDFARMENGNFELTPQDVSLENILQDTVDTLRWQSQSSHTKLIPFCAPDLPMVHADGLRLRQILLSVAGNAVKFSSQKQQDGEVRISLQNGAMRNGIQHVVLQVRDNGIGMTEDTIAEIFRPFTQGDGSIRRRYGGTGLGLSLTKRLVDLMDGRIDVKSVPGEGTTVEIDIPMQAIADRSGHDIGAARALHGKAVFFYGNDPDVAAILRCYVENAGAVLVTEDMPTQKNRHLKPDYVILYGETAEDLDMLSVGGSGAPRLEIVGLPDPTEQDPHGNRIALAELMPSLLIDRLNALSAKPARKPAGAAIPQSKVLLIEDDRMTREITMRMLDKLGIAADAVENGKEGLDLWRSGKYTLLLSDCHMPIMDGFQMASNIRAEETDKHLPKTPIVALSADLTMEIKQLCQRCDIDEYVPKPLTPDKLRTLMATYASNGKAHPDA
ncbi:ATP-binding protein [Thalassovita mangrovi]|uniref:histidine kinase n=1 Tax=Thalassovita mangrovi TaxID=2692236 RepID=A0A6L8LIH4_9RHOB|nr:ATP-binding protein [Thalassovita mangrovi]MYM55655.1 response regulator [Thalassovita mangrovi]